MESTTALPHGLPRQQLPEKFRRRIDLGQAGYALAASAIGLGWFLTRRGEFVDPEGLGYWLGVVGASMMAMLLLYPVRKRVKLFRGLGATRYWFQAHMILGVAGPVLILYHCNFQFGSLNSTIALTCTLLVAGSGLIGRYLHRRVYSNLDGHRLQLRELIAKARVGKEQRQHMSMLAPELMERMSAYDSKVLTPPDSFLKSLALPVVLTFSTRLAAIRLSFYARRQISLKAKQSRVIAAQKKRLRAAASRFVFTHLRRVRRAAELQSYERLFALWHVFHLPFFYLLVVTALIHVLAVHMY